MSLNLYTPTPRSQPVKKGDLDAKHYKENSHLQYSLAQDPLKDYLFQVDETILDIGCGDGKITAQMAEKVPKGQVIGIDKSRSMIGLAKLSYPEKVYPNLKFEIEDIKHLTVCHSFDLITSFSCLHWIENQVIALEKIKQLLNPLGKAIILTFPRCPTFWDPIEFVADGAKWRNYFANNSRPYHFLNEEDYKKIVKELGLKIVNIETSSHVAKFKGKKGFEDYVRGWLPFLIDLPKSLHEEFLEEIGNKSLEFVPLDREGYVNHPYQKILLILEHG
ncbi:Uncharacterized protein PHSC3_001674 [Chlamydiales bacterium STE3]|nr:Uncharacterized protein PHSC3_001674 [Chlamydiales bacterium STE3]